MRVYNKAVNEIMENSIVYIIDCENEGMSFKCVKENNKWYLRSKNNENYLPCCDSLEELKQQISEDWVSELILEINIDNRYTYDWNGQS